MNATKILWGQIFLVSLVVLTFVWTATEWTAWRLGFQPQLGHPWFELLGWPGGRRVRLESRTAAAA